MSFILKALKRVEEEKAVKSQNTPDIHDAIFSGRAQAINEYGRFRSLVYILLILIAGSGITFIIIYYVPFFNPINRSGKLLTKTAQKEATTTSSIIAPAPGVNSSPINVELPDNTRQEKVKEAKTLPFNKVVIPDEASKISPAFHAHKERISRLTVNPPQGLKVNGIAFQDDPSESVAVVNGMLVKRGMSVDGARLEEIFPDRVRFSGKDGPFEVP